MARVHTRTKSTRGKRDFICSGCREKIEPGEEFCTWQLRFGGPRYRHVKCGYPKPTELSMRKTARSRRRSGRRRDIQGWKPELDEDGGYSGGSRSTDAVLVV